ncbi:MAG: SirB2 family protein [Verrucomicrobiaceae bacterium]|nr:SirB2 family protein [Verrucomicrobiaceae bacterium]
MSLTEHFLTIKQAHISLALVSGGLFAIRGVAVLLGFTAAMRPVVRHLSYAIDTVLLASALLLLTVLRLNPLATPWLAVKLALLVCYIVCGSLALKRARTRPRRALAFGAALLCFAMMFLVARSHHPLGFLDRATFSRLTGG